MSKKEKTMNQKPLQLQLLSDLHYEFHQDGGKEFTKSLDPTDIDVLAIAGDLDICRNIENSLTLLCNRYRHSQIVWTMGNHLFYHSNKEKVRAAINRAKIANPNLHVLDNSTTTIKGQRFIGCTLWFPDQPDNYLHERYLNDFHVIKDFRTWNYQANKWSVDYLNKNVKSSDIVVTHHMPTMSAVHPQYRDSNLNRFFVCPMDYIINKSRPSHWIFGHSHCSFNAIYGETQLICNPLGYPHEGNPDFDPHLVIEV